MQDDGHVLERPRWPWSLRVLIAAPFLLAVALGVASRLLLPSGSCGEIASDVGLAIAILGPQVAGWVLIIFGAGTRQRIAGAVVALAGPIVTSWTYSEIEWIGDSCSIVDGTPDRQLAMVMVGGGIVLLALAARAITRMRPTRGRIAAYVVAVPVAAIAWAVLAVLTFFSLFYEGGN